MDQRTEARRGRRLRRVGLVALCAGLFLGAAAALSVVVEVWSSGERSILSPLEWEKLRQRVFRAAEAEPQLVLPAADAERASEDLPPQPPARSRAPRPPASADVLEHQAAAYAADRPKSVVELQPLRTTETLEVVRGGGVPGRATLLNLNPTVNRWYLLLVQWADGIEGAYHLVNGRPGLSDLTLDRTNPSGVTIVDSEGARSCDLWGDGAVLPLDLASRSSSPYVSLCGDEVTLRLTTPGRRTTLEWATDFLRDNVWGGERITVLVRQSLFQDKYVTTSEVVTDAEALPRFDASEEAPASAKLAKEYSSALLVPEGLGIGLEGTVEGKVAAGRWHHVRSHPGLWASVVRPNLIDPDLLRSQSGTVSPLDEVEGEALVYVLAFDLSAFDLGFALGTEHPRVGWSGRVLETVRDPSLPGPDGIDDIAPLVATGIVPRSEADVTVATFTGGFKRDHGAFRVSELATTNQGSHYGFVESGVILSKLQPGLATILVLDDGTVEMKTWTAADDALLPRIVFARQNGLPLVETDPETGAPVAGPRVAQWAAGNWSGSQDRRLRTVRAGAAIQERGHERFLFYAYFSSATPSAMARVFQAYDCSYGMLLDMNALEHTYLATYHVEGTSLTVQHLVEGMEVLDKSVGNQVIPRFLGFADNRDFFYVTRKRAGD